MLYFFEHQELGISAQKREKSAHRLHLFAVFGRCLTGMLFKHFGKIIGGTEPAFLSDFQDRIIGAAQHVDGIFDPHHQSMFCYKYRWFTILLIIGLTFLVCKIYIPPQMLSYEKGMYAAPSLFNNPITYFLNYIIHENLGHNMFCTFGQTWFCYFAGNFIETLVPIIIYLFSLQLRGGLFFSPVLFLTSRIWW